MLFINNDNKYEFRNNLVLTTEQASRLAYVNDNNFIITDLRLLEDYILNDVFPIEKRHPLRELQLELENTRLERSSITQLSILTEEVANNLLDRAIKDAKINLLSGNAQNLVVNEVDSEFWFKRINRYKEFYEINDIKTFVLTGKITEAQYHEITGLVYFV